MIAPTDTLPEIINLIIDFGSEHSSTLLDKGHALLSTLFLLMMSWTGLKLTIHNKQYTTQMTVLLSLIFTWSFAYYALRNYTYLVQSINNGFNDILMNGLHAQSNLVYKNFATMLDALRLMTKHISVPSEQLSNATQIIKNLSELHTGFIIQSLSTGLMALSIALCFAVYAEGQVLFSLSVLLGPILIPWLLFPPLSFLSMGWLRFILISGFYKVLCLLVLMIVSPMIDKILTIANDLDTKSGIGNDLPLGLLHLGGSLVTICLSLLLAKLMWHIPKMAILLTHNTTHQTTTLTPHTP